jgi:hypothetical protein
MLLIPYKKEYLDMKERIDKKKIDNQNEIDPTKKNDASTQTGSQPNQSTSYTQTEIISKNAANQTGPEIKNDFSTQTENNVSESIKTINNPSIIDKTPIAQKLQPRLRNLFTNDLITEDEDEEILVKKKRKEVKKAASDLKDKLKTFTKNIPVIDSIDSAPAKLSMFAAPKLSLQETKDTSGSYMVKKIPPGTRSLNNLKWIKY